MLVTRTKKITMQPSHIFCGCLLMLCCSMKISSGVVIDKDEAYPRAGGENQGFSATGFAKDSVEGKFVQANPVMQGSLPFAPTRSNMENRPTRVPGIPNINISRRPDGNKDTTPSFSKPRPDRRPQGSPAREKNEPVPTMSSIQNTDEKGSKISEGDAINKIISSVKGAANWKKDYEYKIRMTLESSKDRAIFFKRLLNFGMMEMKKEFSNNADVINDIKGLVESELEETLEKGPQQTPKCNNNENVFDKILDKDPNATSLPNIGHEIARQDNDNDVRLLMNEISNIFSPKSPRGPEVPKENKEMLSDIVSFFRSGMTGNRDKQGDIFSLCERMKSFRQKMFSLRDASPGQNIPRQPSFNERGEDLLVHSNPVNDNRGFLKSQFSTDKSSFASTLQGSGGTNVASNGLVMTLMTATFVALIRF